MLNGKYYDCREYADYRFINLKKSSRVTEYQVFKAKYNHARYFPTQDRYGSIYSTLSTYDFNFFGRNNVLWKVNEKCNDLVSPLFMIKESFEGVVSVQLALLIINIITLIILGIIFNILAVFNTLNYDIVCIKGEGVEEYKRLNLIRKMCSYSTKLI